MSRKTDTVELPPGVCREHGDKCAYTGDEKDRCPRCHGLFYEDGGCPCTDLPYKQMQPCRCAGCGELFSSPSAHAQHQVPAGHCLDPTKRGLILVELTDRRNDVWELWAFPGSPEFRG